MGKTTTIGKLAAQLVGQGKKVILAAGDTFRAAAVEQFEIWGQRASVPVVRGKGRRRSLVRDLEAIKRAQREEIDVVIADTAGRLHVKAQLMEELQKVRRVIKKADPSAPHETFLVLDATTGQNAIAQARTFKEMLEITGIVLTKLDGTAKGGVILGIAHELAVPVRYIGIGEKFTTCVLLTQRTLSMCYMSKPIRRDKLSRNRLAVSAAGQVPCRWYPRSSADGEK